MIRRRLTGLLATLGIAALLVGMPALLLTVGFGTLPTIHTWNDVAALLLRPDDGTLALLVLKAVGWVAWATLAALILVEIIALARGIRPRPLPGLHLPQQAAGRLVAAAATLFIALPSQATPAYAAPAPHPSPVATQTVPAKAAPAASRVAAETAAHAPAEDPAAQARTHVVKRGESLWSIAAQELGNGRRYPEIAALNTKLLHGKKDGFLQPGWALTLPAAATKATNTTAEHGHYTSYTVKKGDTLTKIALDHLGAASAYPRIVEASRSIPQPGGRHLTDPDRIDVGWTLHIPTSGASSSQPKTNSKPAEQPPATTDTPAAESEQTAVPATTGAPAEATPQTTAPATPAPAVPAPVAQTAEASPLPATSSPAPNAAAPVPTAAVAVEAEQGSVPPGWLLAGLVGAGTILGGSLWLALRRRRAAQSRHRRPGRLVAAPEPVLAPVEKTLNTAGATTAPAVEFMDEALRRLAASQGHARQPMPVLAAVDVTDTHLRLHLSDPCALPAPWKPAPDQLHWQLSTSTDLDQLGPSDPAVPAPYPQLVTIGADDDGRRWLLNLEDTPLLRVTGDPEFARDFVRYVAAELAVNPWSRDVSVECVGVAAEIVALNPRRVRHHDTADITADVLADTVAMIDRTSRANLDVATGRATLLDDDLWDSRLLLLDTSHSSDTLQQLARLLHDHPRRTGTALVLVGSDTQTVEGDIIQLTPEGRLRMPAVGLDLEAVGLTSDEAAGCAALFTQAEHADISMPAHPQDADGWRAHSNQAGQLREGHTLPRYEPAAEPVESLLPDADEDYLAVAATTPEDLAVLTPQVPVRVRLQVEKDDPTLDDDVRTWFDPACDLPKLTLLGPVGVRVAPTGKPTMAAGRKPYLSELVAYLATRTHGATTEEVAEAMSIPVDRVRKDILTIRTWLGTNPRTGRPHIPDNRQTAAAEARGVNAYQVEGLLVDADLFRRLRVRGESRGPAGLDDLQQALTLVTGTPFSHLRKDGYGWLYEGDRLDQILLCGIVDVAHVVCTASLATGDLAQAQAAAELATRVAPDEETPHLDLAAVLDAQGHTQAAERVIRDRITNRSDDEDGIPDELPDRTERIVDRRSWVSTRSRKRASA